MASATLDPKIDDLYKVPLEEFTVARAALAKTLKGADAHLVKRLQKPTIVPWAANQVYWKARDTYDKVRTSGEQLRRAQIAALALKHRLPSIYTQPAYPEAGGLMSYGADTNNNAHRAGVFVDKILKGVKPGDIPFEQPTRYYLVVNRKTANALDIKPNNELLARADKLIE